MNELISNIDEQSFATKKFKRPNTASFDDFDAYLLPHPGNDVMIERKFNGDLKLFRQDFVQYVVELTVSILAPQNLVVKQLNGQKMSVDLVISYLEQILKVFNDKSAALKMNTISKASLFKQLIEPKFNSIISNLIKSLEF